MLLMQDTSQALQNLASMPSATLLQRLRGQGEALFMSLRHMAYSRIQMALHG